MGIFIFTETKFQAELVNQLVPKQWLFGIAGIVWTGVGLMLCIRAIVWLETFSFSLDLFFELAGIAAAIVLYLYVFSKLVKRNIDRIAAMPPRVNPLAFMALRGYIMIALMITIGILLRSSSIPKYYLSIPYTMMGTMLLIGSYRFYVEFFALRVQQEETFGD